MQTRKEKADIEQAATESSARNNNPPTEVHLAVASGSAKPCKVSVQESVSFLSSFLDVLSGGEYHSRHESKPFQQRRERKRAINRAFAQRKRAREKQEIDELMNHCKQLKAMNQALKMDSLTLETTIKALVAAVQRSAPLESQTPISVIAGLQSNESSLQIEHPPQSLLPVSSPTANAFFNGIQMLEQEREFINQQQVLQQMISSQVQQPLNHHHHNNNDNSSYNHNESVGNESNDNNRCIPFNNPGALQALLVSFLVNQQQQQQQQMQMQLPTQTAQQQDQQQQQLTAVQQQELVQHQRQHQEYQEVIQQQGKLQEQQQRYQQEQQAAVDHQQEQVAQQATLDQRERQSSFPMQQQALLDNVQESGDALDVIK